MKNEDIGDLIRVTRINANLSQKELADKLRVSQNTISELETGKRKPNLEYLNKVFSILGKEVIINVKDVS